MALGDITTYQDADTKAIEFLPSTLAANGPPAGAVGLALSDIRGMFNWLPTMLTLILLSTAGSGVMTVTVRLWGFIPMAGGMWVPFGAGADTTKGVIDNGSAIGEVTADAILHSETIALPGHFQRIYAEVVNIGGTATAVTGFLVARRNYP